MAVAEMRKSLIKKQEKINEIKEKLNNAKIVILFDFTGIDANSVADFRKEIKKVNAEMKVVKNTLLYRACDGTELHDKIEIFEGPTALLLGYEDIVEVAKKLTEFLKEFETAKIKGGLVEGKFATPESIESVAKLPSKEQLIAQLLAVMQAPITNFVRVLNAVPQKLVLVLNAIKEEKEKQG